MDLGFARRAARRTKAGGNCPELANLLAGLAARQAVSPTAKAVTGLASAKDASVTEHPEIDAFVPEFHVHRTEEAAVSFHPRVSANLLSPRKSL
jgi:hypothetical protein